MYDEISVGMNAMLDRIIALEKEVAILKVPQEDCDHIFKCTDLSDGPFSPVHAECVKCGFRPK